MSSSPSSASRVARLAMSRDVAEKPSLLIHDDELGDLHRRHPRERDTKWLIHPAGRRPTHHHVLEVLNEAFADQYEGHVHDLLNDFGKEQVMDEIQGWIDARVPGA